MQFYVLVRQMEQYKDEGIIHDFGRVDTEGADLCLYS